MPNEVKLCGLTLLDTLGTCGIRRPHDNVCRYGRKCPAQTVVKTQEVTDLIKIIENISWSEIEIAQETIRNKPDKFLDQPYVQEYIARLNAIDELSTYLKKQSTKM